MYNKTILFLLSIGGLAATGASLAGSQPDGQESSAAAYNAQQAQEEKRVLQQLARISAAAEKYEKTQEEFIEKFDEQMSRMQQENWEMIQQKADMIDKINQMIKAVDNMHERAAQFVQASCAGEPYEDPDVQKMLIDDGVIPEGSTQVPVSFCEQYEKLQRLAEEMSRK